MLQIIWEYRVRPERVAEFEDYYKGSGAWANLFSKAVGYSGTSLLRQRSDKLRYATIDRWESFALYERFKKDFVAEYAQHDRHCEQFTSDEKLLGYFEVVE